MTPLSPGEEIEGFQGVYLPVSSALQYFCPINIFTGALNKQPDLIQVIWLEFLWCRQKYHIFSSTRPTVGSLRTDFDVTPKPVLANPRWPRQLRRHVCTVAQFQRLQTVEQCCILKRHRCEHCIKVCVWTIDCGFSMSGDDPQWSKWSYYDQWSATTDVIAYCQVNCVINHSSALLIDSPLPVQYLGSCRQSSSLKAQHSGTIRVKNMAGLY